MKLVNPKSFMLHCGSRMNHVAECASVCYDKRPSNPEKLYKRLIDAGHLSMLRHETHYYVIPTKDLNQYYVQLFKHDQFCRISFPIEKKYYLVLNGQWLYEHDQIRSKICLDSYETSESSFLLHPSTIDMIRVTFVLNTQIAISRELNRVSPNSIAERSTRYVDLSKSGDINFTEPHWYKGLSRWKRWAARKMMCNEERIYKAARKILGLKAEDARYFLPLGAETRVVYTYSIKEWESIIEKRFHDSTGKAHPDCKESIKPIHDWIHEFKSKCIAKVTD